MGLQEGLQQLLAGNNLLIEISLRRKKPSSSQGGQLNDQRGERRFGQERRRRLGGNAPRRDDRDTPDAENGPPERRRRSDGGVDRPRSLQRSMGDSPRRIGRNAEGRLRRRRPLNGGRDQDGDEDRGSHGGGSSGTRNRGSDERSGRRAAETSKSQQRSHSSSAHEEGEHLTAEALVGNIPKPSQLTRSEFLSHVYAIQEEMAAAQPTTQVQLEKLRDRWVKRIEKIRDECEEKLEHMPEALRTSDTGTLLKERAHAMDQWASELQEVELEIDDSDDKEEAILERLRNLRNLAEGVPRYQ
jgi:hypothetical protein